MQLIRLGETTAGLIEVPFTTVDINNLQTRLLGTDLPNASISVWIKKAGVANAVAGVGAFTATDDTNAKGVRGYKPAVADFVVGVSTFVFTGTSGGKTMEPREMAVMVVNDDPYRPVYYGSVVAGTLSTGAFTTDRTETTLDAWRDAMIEFLSGPNAGAPKLIGGFTGTGTVGTFTLKTGFTLPVAPTVGDKFRIVTR